MNTKYPLIILFICLLGSKQIFSQKQEVIDSLQSVIESEASSDKKLLAYKKIVKECLDKDAFKLVGSYIEHGIALAKKVNDKEAELFIKSFRGEVLLNESKQGVEGKETTEQARKLFQEILQISEEKLYATLKVQVLNGLGNSYLEVKNYDEAQNYLEKSLTIYHTLSNNDKESVNSPYQYLCRLFIDQSNFEIALKYAKELLEYNSTIGNLSGMAKAHNYMGTIFYKQANDNKAIINHTKAVHIYEQLEDKKSLANALIDMAVAYSYVDGKEEQSLQGFHRSLKLSLEIGNEELLDKGIYGLGNYFRLKNQQDSAVYYFNRSINYNKKIGNISSNIKSYNRLGSMYAKNSKMDLALDYYFKGLKNAEKLNDYSLKAIIYNNIGSVYHKQNQYKKTLTYAEKSLENFILAKNYSRIAEVKNNLSSLSNIIKEYSKGLQYSKEALEQFKIFKDSCNIGSAYGRIGHSYEGLQQLDSAIIYYNKAISIELNCKTENISMLYVLLGRNYLKKGQKDDAFQAFEKGLETISSSKDLESITSVTKYLYPLYKERGQYKKAFETLDLYHSAKDSLFNEENTRVLVQKEMTYNFEKEQQQEAFLQQQKEAEQQRELEEKNWIIYIAIVTCLAFIGLTFALYRNFKNKKKANILLRSQNEEIVRQKARLEELNESKSRLYANISHEFRTPLTLISSPIEHMLTNEKDQLNTNQTVQLKMVERNAKQLKGLINDILDLSKLESNKLELQEVAVSVVPFLRRTVSNFDSLAQHLGIQYEIDLDLPEDAYVLLDREKVEKVINNLLSNAIKHTPSGGSIKFTAFVSGDSLQFQVIDTGHGIPEENLPYIFDRFFQSKNSHDTLQGGTGIGLALVKELAQLMNGEITVTSKLEEGSTFLLSLAYNEVEVSEVFNADFDVEEEEEENDLVLIQKEVTKTMHTHKVLIVEDHPDMQRFIQQLLDHKYETFVANHGKQALEILKKESIDLVISDVMMPEMDGYTLLQELKDHDSYCNLPVIMLTSLDNSDSKLKALTIGVDDYLSKPFSPEELMARVDNLLQRYEVRQIVAKEMQEEIKEAQIEATVSEGLSSEQDIKRTDVNWLKEVEGIIHNELENTEFNISTLADRFFLSQRQFQRKMKKVTGLTPKKFQQEVALQEGRKLLENKTYRSVKAIAFTIGMSNVWRFSKLYEDRFGKKPSEYF